MLQYSDLCILVAKAPSKFFLAVYIHDVSMNLTLRTLGGGQNDPQRNKCLRNSENRKKNFKKTTNLPHPPSSPLPP